MNADEILTEICFWTQVMTDAERTIICSPANEDRIRAWIDTQGLGHLLTVTVSSLIPSDSEIFVIDNHAIEASTREHPPHPSSGESHRQ